MEHLCQHHMIFVACGLALLKTSCLRVAKLSIPTFLISHFSPSFHPTFTDYIGINICKTVTISQVRNFNTASGIISTDLICRVRC